MSRLLKRLLARVRPRRRGENPSLDHGQARVLAENLRLLLHTKEALAERENAA